MHLVTYSRKSQTYLFKLNYLMNLYVKRLFLKVSAVTSKGFFMLPNIKGFIVNN